jgi:hypothetical protein
MPNYKCRVNGALPQGMTWTTGFNMLSTASISAVASALDSAWNTLWTDATGGLTKWVHSDVTTINTTVVLADVNWRQQSKLPTPRALAGTNANITTNLANSPYATFTGANATKSDQGRMKFPPFAADQISAGLILNATVDAFAVVLSAFFVSMSGLAAAQIVSFNRHVNKQGDPVFTAHQLTGGTFKNRPGTERARQRKLKATHSATITF